MKEWNEVFKISKSVGAVPIMATMNPSGRGVDLYELVGLKDGSKKRQPMVPWHYVEREISVEALA